MSRGRFEVRTSFIPSKGAHAGEVVGALMSFSWRGPTTTRDVVRSVGDACVVHVARDVTLEMVVFADTDAAKGEKSPRVAVRELRVYFVEGDPSAPVDFEMEFDALPRGVEFPMCEVQNQSVSPMTFTPSC